MKNSTIVWIIIVILVILGLVWWSNNTSVPDTGTVPSTNSPIGTSTTPADMNPVATATLPGTTTPSMQPATKEFTVTGKNFNFSPAQITVNKGDRVRITFKNEAGFHDLKIDEFNAGTKQIDTNAEETFEFIADKTGTFDYYCSVYNHRQMGMVGKLTVN
ncbi:MAG TPA: cupredoxin domain-containing protein [Patescibacteria group bacterium]|nr:cupredoxin domain-containing protein [Patescibacteria group bacterium]